MEHSDNDIQIKMICNTSYLFICERYTYDTHEMLGMI